MTTANELKNLRERIAESDEIADIDRAVLDRFDDRLTLLNQTYTDLRHLKLLRHVTIIAESLPDETLADALDSRDAAEDIVAWVNRTYSNEETNRDYRSALRVFGKRVTDGDDWPDSISWVPTSTSSDYDPTPDPREMLRWEDDIQPMLDAAPNSRARALIALQFDAGLRGGELKSLRIGDLQSHKHGLQVTVDGKQGQRTLLLIPAVPHVNNWLADHPARDDSDAPLWSHLRSPQSISDRMLYDIFESAADDAGVDKPVTPTNFRKSSAAFLASRNLNQAHIEDHHGWVRGSDACARYIAVFGSDTDRELARLHGRDVSEDEPDRIDPLDCPTCGHANDRTDSFCSRCGQVLDPGTAAEVEVVDENIQRQLAALDPDDAEKLLDVLDALESADVRDSVTD